MYVAVDKSVCPVKVMFASNVSVIFQPVPYVSQRFELMMINLKFGSTLTFTHDKLLQLLGNCIDKVDYFTN